MPQPPKKKPGQTPPPDETDDTDTGADDDVPMTKADIIKLVNGAVSGQFGRKMSAFETSLLAKLDERDKARAAPKDGEDETDDAGDDTDTDIAPPKKKGATRPDAGTLKLQRQLADMQRQIKERDDKLVAEGNARKAATVDGALTDALTKLGVDPHRMRGALAVHKASAFVDDADGKVRFKMKRDGYEEDLDPADALAEWGATDEGKSYIAASGSNGGAGARAPKSPGPGRRPAANTPEGKVAAQAEARSQLFAGVGELIAGGSIAIE